MQIEFEGFCVAYAKVCIFVHNYHVRVNTTCAFKATRKAFLIYFLYRAFYHGHIVQRQSGDPFNIGLQFQISQYVASL